MKQLEKLIIGSTFIASIFGGFIGSLSQNLVASQVEVSVMIVKNYDSQIISTIRNKTISTLECALNFIRDNDESFLIEMEDGTFIEYVSSKDIADRVAYYYSYRVSGLVVRWWGNAEEDLAISKCNPEHIAIEHDEESIDYTPYRKATIR